MKLRFYFVHETLLVVIGKADSVHQVLQFLNSSIVWTLYIIPFDHLLLFAFFFVSTMPLFWWSLKNYEKHLIASFHDVKFFITTRIPPLHVLNYITDE